MKIIINGEEFEDASWIVDGGLGILMIQTDRTIIDILSSIGENESINVYDGENLVSTWQNNGVKAAENTGESRMRLSFDVSILTRNAEAQIHSEIDESIDGIFELAELMDSMDETVTGHSDSIEALEERADSAEDGIAEINRKIAEIPDDITDRFSTLWSNYNALADRVAQLENKEG